MGETHAVDHLRSVPPRPDSTSKPKRPEFTVARAAEVCGVSPSTIRRRIKDGSLANSEKDARGVWRIPVTDLIAAGLEPGRPAPAPDASADVSPDPDDRGDGPVDEIEELRRELEETRRRLQEARHRGDVAEQIAAERQSHISDLRAALRQLDPGPPVESCAHEDAYPRGAAEESRADEDAYPRGAAEESRADEGAQPRGAAEEGAATRRAPLDPAASADRSAETPEDRRRGAWPKAPDDSQMTWLFDPEAYDSEEDDAEDDDEASSGPRSDRSGGFWRRTFGRP